MVDMFNWFKNKQNEEPEKVVSKIVVPCVCESNSSEHCDLILKLRELQKIEKELKKEIETMDKDVYELMFNFIGFLKTLEDNGYVMNDSRGWRIPDNYFCSEIIKRTIRDYSYDDIFRITEELRVYKNKENILIEKQRVLKEIKNKIKDIKDKLGIE